MAKTPDGKIVIGGRFFTSMTFGPITLATYGSQDLYIARVDSSGVFSGSRRFGSSISDLFGSVAVDSLGRTVVTMMLNACTGDYNIGVPISCANNSIILAQYAEGAEAPVWHRIFSS